MILGVRKFFIITVSKRTTMFVVYSKSKAVADPGEGPGGGAISGHRIDYNGVGALRGQRHIPSKNQPK